jgi:hypothetical protein
MAIIEYQLDALVTVSGGFHNVGPMRLRIRGGDESLSAGQYKRLKKHLCGIEECQCETLKHDVSGIDAKRWEEILFNSMAMAHKSFYRAEVLANAGKL